MKLTDEQNKAIKTIDKNVIVNAGAGTGKTEVLTRRYIELLKYGKLNENEEISSIVAITFTIKAANEMKERVRDLIKSEDNMNYDLNDSQISTIHSFCSKIIRENSYYLDINPDFSILDDKESSDILNSAIIESIKSNERYLNFLELFLNKTSENDVNNVFTKIKEIYKNINNTLYSIEEIKDITLENIKKLNKYSKSEEIIEELQYIKDKVKLSKSNKIYKFLDKYEKLEELDFNDINLFIELQESLKTMNKEEYDYIKEILNLELEYKEYLNKDIYIMFFEILEIIDLKFKSKKNELGKFDFSDLEHLTLQLLKNEYVRNKIQSEINYLMIDEYQDSNDIQKEIFYKICSKNKSLDRNNIFIVGDPKQSIYGFRGANVDVFNDTLKDVIDSNGELIIFGDNYRTESYILNGINNIYSDLMGERYNFLESKGNFEDQGVFKYVDIEDKKEESEIISNYIASNISAEEKLGDNVLLFRSRNGQNLYENSFKKRNIPFYTFNSLGFFDSTEIKLVIEILKLMKYEINEFSLYHILKSDIYNITDEDMLDYINGDSSKYIDQYISDIINKTNKLSEINQDSVVYFLDKLFDIFELYEIYNFNEKNIQKQGNLYKLRSIGEKYDDENLTFNDFFYFLLNNNGDENMKQVEDENSDVVKLMTIHGSKGLGFKNVIVPYINSGSVNKISMFNFNENIGIGINFKAANYRSKEILEMEKNTKIIEDDNLFYVAMTRAKESLILGMSGRKSNYKKRLFPKVEQNKENNLISELKSEEFTKIEEEYLEKKELKNVFQNLKLPSIDCTNIFNLNISEVLEKNNEKIIYKEANLNENVENDSINLPYNIIGNIIHRFAEKYTFPYELKLESILEEYNIGNEYYDFFIPYVENFKGLYNYDFEEANEEVSFYYMYKNYFFRGIIDRIELYNNKIRIIDYKFSKLDKLNLEKQYWIQLAFYGMVCEEAFKDKEIELVIKNIRKNYEIEIEYNSDLKTRLKEKLDAYIAELI